ncbi:MAG: hypothetical protein E7375_01600 [Clostridiales bacterium]|nr:hypothetical protein [Clostridiales bacterium]
MKEVWTQKFKKAFIWASGLISFIAFAIVGGYTITKSEDEELKKTSKTAFIVTLVFLAIEAILFIISAFGSMGANYYNSGLYDFHTITTKIVSVAKYIVYAVFIILSLCLSPKQEKSETTSEK